MFKYISASLALAGAQTLLPTEEKSYTFDEVASMIMPKYLDLAADEPNQAEAASTDPWKGMEWKDKVEVNQKPVIGVVT